MVTVGDKIMNSLACRERNVEYLNNMWVLLFKLGIVAIKV